MENLTSLRFKLSVDKCQAIAIISKQNLNRQRTGQVVFNRSPCFKINNKGIRVSTSLKYLGINIDNRLTWTAHIMTLHSKIFKLTQNFNRIVQSDFSIDKHILKTWYFVVIEKALLYGAGVWGGSLNNENIKRLTTIQRVFPLKFMKEYRTTSTQVLGVLAGIPPLYLSARAEFQKFQVWVCRSSELGRVLDVGELDHFVKLSSVPIEFRTIDIKPQIENSQFEVYTDGSRIRDDCGFSMCILKNEHPFKIFKFKLSKNNTVFQAELAAINFAVRWAQEKGFKLIYIPTVNPRLKLCVVGPRSAFVIEAKKNIYLAGNSVGLNWVEAHVGDPGNELADHHAKLATTDGENMNVQTPLSCVKFKITNNLMKDWQYNWENYDSDSGNRARNCVPCVNKKLLVHNKCIIYFLTGYGPLPCYLHRFKKLNSPLCPCGRPGDADHYVFHCPLTKEHHLKEHALNNRVEWFKNLLKNRECILRLEKIFRFCGDLCNRLNQY
ncbi:hypothetical protein AVEN_3937-1 [Araneus ventricosus]|uniref:Uncharacterized protein n=1 Tax=Araneus ventricosus TaxID=182803 RepID=A0A4Y2L1Q7_ARAVE|nr:hypothetical protein AVEN_3937-1 [Araneus ventricosus]